MFFLQVEREVPSRTSFPDIYREFESLQVQVRQAAQDYIHSPQTGANPLEVRNIEVRTEPGLKRRGKMTRTDSEALVRETFCPRILKSC